MELPRARCGALADSDESGPSNSTSLGDDSTFMEELTTPDATRLLTRERTLQALIAHRTWRAESLGLLDHGFFLREEGLGIGVVARQ